MPPPVVGRSGLVRADARAEQRRGGAGGDGAARVPAGGPLAQTWHCLLHHSGSSSSASATAASSSSPGGSAVCELSVQPPMEVRNLLAGPLRFELLGSGVAHAKALNSGESLRTHAFAQGTAVSFSMAISGYGTSERQLVACPPSYDDEVLCRAVTLLDPHGNQLDVKIHYEVGAGCVHTLSLYAPYWVVNHTGLPLSMREFGAMHGFSGDESAVVREVVCENQARTTGLNGFTPEESLPFSDERMQRRHVSLSAVWLPPGWVWLDDAWDVDRETHDVDEQGWRYAHSFTPMLELGDMDSGWAGAQYFTSLVRQRRWFRHRALAAKMDAATAARLSDDAIGRMSAPELRMTIASGGLGHRDCNSRDMLRARAKEARDAARDGGGGAERRSRGDGGGGGGGSGSGAGGGGGSAPLPLMPPCASGSRLQLQLPGSIWSHPMLLEAAGTHGLLEIESEEARACRSARPHSASWLLSARRLDQHLPGRLRPLEDAHRLSARHAVQRAAQARHRLQAAPGACAG